MSCCCILKLRNRLIRAKISALSLGYVDLVVNAVGGARALTIASDPFHGILHKCNLVQVFSILLVSRLC